MSDAPGWSEWKDVNRHIGSKLRESGLDNIEHYFLKIHSASEALMRRVLFIGLRKNYVRYEDANTFLYNNDVTPGREYGSKFDKLYPHGLSFDQIINEDDLLKTIWPLWLKFAKPVRNNVSHGKKSYGDDWYITCIQINQHLMMGLNSALVASLGGSASNHLELLRPRLPKGHADVDVHRILGMKAKSQRQSTMALACAQEMLASIAAQAQRR